MSERIGRPRAQVGVARTITPVAVRDANGKVTFWRALYRDGDNSKRRAGNHRTAGRGAPRGRGARRRAQQGPGA